MAPTHVWWIQIMTASLYPLCIRRWAILWNGLLSAYLNHCALKNTAYHSFYLFIIVCYFSGSNCTSNVISLKWFDRPRERERERERASAWEWARDRNWYLKSEKTGRLELPFLIQSGQRIPSFVIFKITTSAIHWVLSIWWICAEQSPILSSPFYPVRSVQLLFQFYRWGNWV